MKCQAEVERTIRPPGYRKGGHLGSRREFRRELGRCSRNALYERALFPVPGTDDDRQFRFTPAKVCAQHFRGERPRMAAESNDAT